MISRKGENSSLVSVFTTRNPPPREDPHRYRLVQIFPRSGLVGMETFYIKGKSRTEYSCCTTHHPFLALLITKDGWVGRRKLSSTGEPFYMDLPQPLPPKEAIKASWTGSRSTHPMTCNSRQPRKISSFHEQNIF